MMTNIFGELFTPPITPLLELEDGSLVSTSVINENRSSVSGMSYNFQEVLFPIAQDLVLVRYRCFKPELKMEEVILRFKDEFNVHKTAQELDKRLQKLNEPEMQALLVLYLNIIAGKPESRALNSIQPLAKYETLMLQDGSESEKKLKEIELEEEKLSNESAEMLPVEVTGRNFPKFSRMVPKNRFRRWCRNLEKLFVAAPTRNEKVTSFHGAFTLQVGLGHMSDKLHLSDTCEYYDHFLSYNHLDQPIFDRLIQFTNDPFAMERLILYSEQREEMKRIQQESRDGIEKLFDREERHLYQILEKVKNSEYEQVKTTLEKSLEEDILHLKQMYNKLLAHEKAKIEAKYAKQVAVARMRVEEIKSQAIALQKSTESSYSTDQLDRMLLEATIQVERVFGTSDYILRLLLLSEDLDIPMLRQGIIKYLSKPGRFLQFALRREFSSKLIAETTVICILKALNMKDLREIEAFEQKFEYQHLVHRELQMRRTTLVRYLAGITNDCFRSVLFVSRMSDKTFVPQNIEKTALLVTDFPEVLQQEYSRRREFSSVRMNTNQQEKKFSFSDEDCVIQLESSHQYCTALATKERKQGELGKWMYEIIVEEFSGEGDSLLIGWEIPRSKQVDDSSIQEKNLAELPAGLYSSSGDKSYGITWQSDSGLEVGIIHANGQSKSGVASFRAKDVIGCVIDQDDSIPSVRFYLNGEVVLPSPAWISEHSLIKNSSHPNGIQIQNSAYCLFPAVSMYSSKKRPLMRVRFNFRGDFKFPIDGYEPYGAPL